MRVCRGRIVSASGVARILTTGWLKQNGGRTRAHPGPPMATPLYGAVNTLGERRPCATTGYPGNITEQCRTSRFCSEPPGTETEPRSTSIYQNTGATRVAHGKGQRGTQSRRPWPHSHSGWSDGRVAELVPGGGRDPRLPQTWVVRNEVQTERGAHVATRSRPVPRRTHRPAGSGCGRGGSVPSSYEGCTHSKQDKTDYRPYRYAGESHRGKQCRPRGDHRLPSEHRRRRYGGGAAGTCFRFGLDR